jgi:hypothetical protein
MISRKYWVGLASGLRRNFEATSTITSPPITGSTKRTSGHRSSLARKCGSRGRLRHSADRLYRQDVSISVSWAAYTHYSRRLPFHCSCCLSETGPGKAALQPVRAHRMACHARGLTRRRLLDDFENARRVSGRTLFRLVFDKLLPLSQRPEQVLRELHRPSAELQYNHTYAYSPGTHLANRQYRAEFSHEVTTRKILAFYVRHPGIGFEILSSDFHLYAPDIPVGNFGTMRRADNPEPVFRANGLRIWSTLRGWSCLRWPWHIPPLYLAVGLYGFFCRNRLSGMWLLGLTLCTVGCLSFAISSLGDAEETSRHIVLFQEATDMLFVIALAVSSPMACVRYDRSPPPSSGAFAPLT